MASDHLDLSQVYGTTAETTNHLRSHSDGKLRTHSHLPLLPTTKDRHHCLLADTPSSSSSSCLQSGDSRVNFSPYQILQHSNFQQSHNNIAHQLKALKPQWTDEKLFHAAQRINRAVFQKITFEEWLPMVVGYRQGVRIRTQHNNEELSRGVSNEFATAAIRFYQSMLPGDLQNNHQKRLFELRDTFYRPQALNWTREIRTQIVSSTLLQKAMALDTSFVDDVSVDAVFSSLHRSVTSCMVFMSFNQSVGG